MKKLLLFCGVAILAMAALGAAGFASNPPTPNNAPLEHNWGPYPGGGRAWIRNGWPGYRPYWVRPYRYVRPPVYVYPRPPVYYYRPGGAYYYGGGYYCR